MLTLDGSHGEGGGQVLRSALALAMITGQPFRMHSIRAGRRAPGLRSQHLTGVRAAATVCSARVEGDRRDSTSLTFVPSVVSPGNYHFSVGTAGSACLVVQTVLPALLGTSGASTVTVEGGTHNSWAPPFDFLQKVFFPILARMGWKVDGVIERHGFYPAGGGRIVIQIEPNANPTALNLIDRGEPREARARALLARLPEHIARRELDLIAKRLELSPSALDWQLVESNGPGNAVWVEVNHTEITELFTAFGKRGVPVPDVVEPLMGEVEAYNRSSAPVGVHLADQLLLPLMLAGGVFATMPLSLHATTNIDTIVQFCGARVTTREQEDRTLVEVVEPLS